MGVYREHPGPETRGPDVAVDRGGGTGTRRDQKDRESERTEPKQSGKPGVRTRSRRVRQKTEVLRTW